MFLVFSCTSAGACFASFLALSSVTDSEHRLLSHALEPKPKGVSGDPLLALFSWIQRAVSGGFAAAASRASALLAPERMAHRRGADGEEGFHLVGTSEARCGFCSALVSLVVAGCAIICPAPSHRCSLLVVHSFDSMNIGEHFYSLPLFCFLLCPFRMSTALRRHHCFLSLAACLLGCREAEASGAGRYAPSAWDE